MMDFLRRFLSNPVQDVLIAFPGVELSFNHRLKIAVLYDADPDAPEEAYMQLEAHLAKRGYFLQVVTASRGTMIVREGNDA